MKILLGIWIVFFPFKLLAQQPKLMLPIGHIDKVNSVKFSPNGKRFITGSTDQTAKLWDTETSKILANFTGHDDQVKEALFSADGKYIVTAGGEKLFIWDALTGKMIREIKEVESFISVLKISPDSKKIFIGLANGHVQIFEIATGKLLKNLNSYLNIPEINNFPQELKLVLEDLDKRIKEESDADDKKDLEEERKELIQESKKAMSFYKNSSGIIPMVVSDVSLICFSNDNKLFVTGVNDLIKVWDIEKFDIVKEIKRPGFGKLNCSFDATNTVFLIFVAGGFIDTWNVKSGNKVHNFDNSKTLKIVYSGFNGKETLFSLFENGLLKIYNHKTGNLVTKLNVESGFGKIIFAKLLPNSKELFTTYQNGQIIKWDIDNGQKIKEFIGHKNEILDIEFSSDNNKMISSSKDNTVKVWEVGNGRVLADIDQNPRELNSAFFSEDHESIIVNQNRIINVWNIYNGQSIKTIQHDEKDIEFARFENKKIIISDNSGKYKLLTEPNIFKSVDDKLQNYYNIKFGYRNPDYHLSEKKYPTSGNDRVDFTKIPDVIKLDKLVLKENIKIVPTKESPFFKKVEFYTSEFDDRKNKIYSISPSGDGILNFAKFNSDGSRLLVSSSEGMAFEYSSKYWDNYFDLKGHQNSVNYVDYSKDNSKALTASSDGTAKIWDLKKEGLILNTLTGHTSKVNTVQFNNDETKILTSSKDNTFKLWNAKNGRLISTSFSLDNLKLFTLLPSGYYFGSNNTVKKIHFVADNLSVISFEQLDVKYNRPDKVLQAIGNTDTLLINSYRRAYEKRVEKLKIDTTAFKDNYTVPDADFVNRDVREVNGKVTLTIKGEDKKTKLDQYNVWVNEVPIYGLRGVNIRKNNSNILEVTVTIPLSVGENKIETSVRNINGIESYRKPLSIVYTPKIPPKEKVYFVGIGIDKFADASHNLQYSADDIRKLAIEMEKKYGKNNIVIDTLINKNVTVKNVKTLKERLLNTTVNDKVIVAYSGHGLLNSKKDYYLSTYFMNFSNPEQNGLLYDDLENIIDSIPARKKLLLLDACHSGEVDKGATTSKPTTSNEPSNKSDQPKGMETVIQRPKVDGKPIAKESSNRNRNKKGGDVDENQNRNNIGLQNSFELMQSLFVNVGKNTGATIYAAAGGLQSALESRDLQQSIFTYAFLQALKKPTMKVSELKDVVTKIVEQKSNKEQRPTSRSETIAVDWILW